jgi:dolichol-phosphate mannosyltransferase
MTRGLIDWLGFKRAFVYFEAPARINGDQRYNSSKRLKLAVTSIVSHSLLPLKLAGYLGIAITTIAGLLGLFIFIERYILNDPLGLNFSGPAILAVIILFLVGIILICLGLIAIYIGTIKTEISGRPLYVIRDKKISHQNKCILYEQDS